MYLLPLKVNYNSLIFSLLFFGSNLLYAKDAMVFDADDPDKAALKIKDEAKTDKKGKKTIDTSPLVKSRKTHTPKPLETADERDSPTEVTKTTPETKPSPTPSSSSAAPIEKEIDGDLYEEVPEE